MGDLFDSLPEVYFFAKDVQGRFVRMNRELVKALGLREESEVLGETDFDFFTPELADRYRREDQMVMDAGQPIHNQVWQVPTVTGVINWYLGSKMPSLLLTRPFLLPVRKSLCSFSEESSTRGEGISNPNIKYDLSITILHCTIATTFPQAQ